MDAQATPSTVFAEDELYTPQAVAAKLLNSQRTLEQWRKSGKGPRFIKVGRRVCYRGRHCNAWLDEQTRHHTAQHTAAA